LIEWPLNFLFPEYTEHYSTLFWKLTPQTLAACWRSVLRLFFFSKKCDSFSRPRDLPC